MQSRVTGQNQNMERFIFSSVSSNTFAALSLVRHFKNSVG